MEKNVLTREEAKAVEEEIVPGVKFVCAMVEMDEKGNKRRFLDVLIEELEELARRTKTRITAGADACRNDAPTKNATEPVTVDFGDAIRLLKSGHRLARMGWNGKGQYVELAHCISYTGNDGTVVNASHQAIGNRALAFVGTSGVQLGWLASQADMLAEDWYVVG